MTPPKQHCINVNVFDNYDYEKSFQASAILNEYDFESRASATQIMVQEERYKNYIYGDADYFIQWEKIVKKEYTKLLLEKGPPHNSYDGATGLPLISIYNRELSQTGKHYRRHSMAYPPHRINHFLSHPEIIEKQQQVRRSSLTLQNCTHCELTDLLSSE
eukprot:EST43363.1 hypothetical protein SS50377_17042 [Spironucleus salmonicida]